MLGHKRPLAELASHSRPLAARNHDDSEALLARKRQPEFRQNHSHHHHNLQQQSYAERSQQNRLQNERARRQRTQAEEEEDEDENERLRWRQEAQMLTDDDGGGDNDNEFLLRSNGARARNEAQNNQHQVQKRRARNSPIAQDEQDVDVENLDEDENLEDDDNSSISFAQSGCHSILSAWRLKANRRNQRRPVSVLSNGSSCVTRKSLASQATSAFGRNPKSPAAQTRIPLGPRQAQHYVTNTRRRRRANELILSTLEARRRALALARHNASLLGGSATYLAEEAEAEAAAEAAAVGDYGRLSLSPSPAAGVRQASPVSAAAPGNQAQLHNLRSRAPLVAPAQATLSDLGAPNLSSAAVQAQRQRLLMDAARNGRKWSPQPAVVGEKKKVDQKEAAAKNGKRQQPPPLAKLDQNSSDLYTSNSSTGGSSDESSSSTSGSQFTQLVSSELAPGCVLLDEQALNQRAAARQEQQRHLAAAAAVAAVRQEQQQRSHWTSQPACVATHQGDLQAPKVAERARRRQGAASPGSDSLGANADKGAKRDTANGSSSLARDKADDGGGGGRLRRSALRRDSVRRLRLSRMPGAAAASQEGATGKSALGAGRAPSSPGSGDSSSGSANNGPIRQQVRQSKVRALDGRSASPLRHSLRSTGDSSSALDRGQFRSTSVRAISNEPVASRQSSSRQSGSSSKWNSWSLFGLVPRGSTAAATPAATPSEPAPAPRPRLFGSAAAAYEAPRRANSSEAIHRAGRGGQQQQPSSKQHADPEGVRQVEKMLRQMKPNQVFTSYAKESQLMRSEATTTTTTTTSRPSSEVRRAASPASRSARDSSPRRNETREAAPRASVRQKREGQANRRLVNETKKSRDDLRFDALGNRQHYELDEFRRHEKSDESQPRREERLISERIEIMRSTSISPPAEFADSSSQARKQAPSGARTTSETATRNEWRPLVAASSTRISPTTSKGVDEQEEKPRWLGQQQQQHSAAREPAPKAAEAPTRRSASEERPRVAARRRPPEPRPVSGQQVEQQQRRQQQQHQAATATPPQRPQSSSNLLPKFERTADDEFRKRVDYLRKLARANLSQEEPAISSKTSQQITASNRSSLGSAPGRPLTKPASINWTAEREESNRSGESEVRRRELQRSLSGPRTAPSGGGLFDDVEQRAKWKFGPLASSSSAESPAAGNESSRAHLAATSTNLDQALLADRYQSREQLAGGAPRTGWRRSNSSLASVGLTRRPDLEAPATSVSPPAAQVSSSARAPLFPGPGQPSPKTPSEQSADSRSSQRPSQLTSSAVVRLVVKEKSAPKLDYAFVEQRPGQVEMQQVHRHQLLHQAQPAAQTRPMQAQPRTTRLPPGGGGGSQSAAGGKQQAPGTGGRARSPLRVASPRSPEFGAMAASSNDDSAIASSVSSPSLSFMMNPDQQRAAAAAASSGNACAGMGRSVSPVAGANKSQPLGHLLALRMRPSDTQQTHSPGLLQSILRRHEQQQPSTGESSDSSLATRHQATDLASPSASHQRTTSTPGQVSGALKRPQALEQQPQEPLVRSDARSPEPSMARPTYRSAAGVASPVDQDERDTNESQAAQQQSMPAKRVHFNDRTSIRSFESISSLASNSTAVPAAAAGQIHHQLLRQQFGSPDSMGSGSTSRLSGDSPDLRRAPSSGGAAIYAVRGDPELEPLAGSGGSLAAGQSSSPSEAHLAAAASMMAGGRHEPARSYTISSRVSGGQASYGPHTGGEPMQQRAPMSYIRMTAPPSIGAQQQQHSPHLQATSSGGPVHYIVRPTSLTSTQIVPTTRPPVMAAASPAALHLRSPNAPVSQRQVDDDEDPSYALRLRQAATSRVFNYVASLSPAQQQQQQQQPAIQRAPPTAAHLSPSGAAQGAQAPQSGSTSSRRPLDGLLNFQTEV